jgi:hypothetical protein
MTYQLLPMSKRPKKPTLFTAQGESIKPFNDRAKNIVNTTCVIYGPPKTGKTFFCQHLMFLLKPFIPTVFVVSLTEPSNQKYKGIVAPGGFIMETIDVKRLEEILERQTIAAGVYTKVNDVERLAKLYLRRPSRTIDANVEKINKRRKIHEHKIEHNSQLNDAEKSAQKEKMTEDFTELLVNIFKMHIKKHNCEYSAMNLTKEDREVLEYFEYNPNILLVFDDCGSNIKALLKKPLFRQMFYQNRHLRITLFFLLQNENDLDSNLRGTVFRNFFTSQKSANKYFENKTNSFDKDTRAREIRASSTIFKYNKYAVMIYDREAAEDEEFNWYVAASHGKFQMGSPVIWELGKLVELNTEKNNINSFSKVFAVK